MLNPLPFLLTDYFGTKDVTLPRLQKFSVDVLTRLTEDNPDGVFDQLIADLTTYHQALFGAMTGMDAGTSQRRTHAQIMWGALTDLQHQLAEDKDLIEYKSKKNPAIYQAFFPNGRREYDKASLLTAELLLTRAKNAATTYARDLGADFDAAPYARFLKDFVSGRQGTGQGDEQTDKARAAAQGHRDDLTRRLTDAVKLVAAQHLRDEPRAAAYFQVGLLQAPEKKAKAKPATAG